MVESMPGDICTHLNARYEILFSVLRDILDISKDISKSTLCLNVMFRGSFLPTNNINLKVGYDICTVI